MFARLMGLKTMTPGEGAKHLDPVAFEERDLPALLGDDDLDAPVHLPPKG